MQTPAADSIPPPPAPEFSGQVLPRDMLTPALRSDPESFPVLKAFQEYIEAERERARRRLLTVAALSITAIVLIVAAFLAVGTVVIGALMRRNDLLLENVLRAAVRDAAAPTPVPAAVAPAPAGDARLAELARLDAALRALQSDYAALQGQVGALQARPPATPPATTVEPTLPNLSARAPASVSRAPVAPAPSPPPPAGAAPFAPPVALPTQPASAPAPVSRAPALGATAAAGANATTATTATTTTPATAVRPARTTVISVPARVENPPRIAGYAPARLTLVTDRGVAVPWRVVIPE